VGGRILAAALLVATLSTLAASAGRVMGYVRSTAGGGWGESHAFLQMEGPSQAEAYYTGGSGWFNFHSAAPGSYCLFGYQRYVCPIDVPDGGIIRQDLRRQADYWVGNGDFIDSHEFAQTFIARGRSISHISIDVANFDRVYVLTVHEGGPSGAQIGPTKAFHADNDKSLSFKYLYGDILTVPGRRYCVKVISDIGAMIRLKIDEHNAYSMGTLRLDGIEHPGWDLAGQINVDRHGMMTTHQPVSGGCDGESDREIAQTFVAQGNYMVAAFLLATYGSEAPPTGLEVSVLEDDAYGAEVCPRKTVGGANDWVHGTGWVIGECPLTPGETYYLRWTRRYLETWFLACYGMVNQYPDGMLWTDRDEPHPDKEALCIIWEHSGHDPIDISGLRAENDDSGTVTVRWSTPVACSSQVEYWLGDGPHAMTELDETDVTEHAVAIAGLTIGQTLHFVARSWTQGWQESESVPYSITVGAGGSQVYALGPGWEMIGYVSDESTSLPLSECRVSDGALQKTWDEAVSAGWVQDGMFYYDGTAYRLLKTSGGNSDAFLSGGGYWILNESGVPLSLLVP